MKNIVTIFLSKFGNDKTAQKNYIQRQLDPEKYL